MQTKDHNKSIERPPVIAIMGHVDHGKSTLLDYIRKTNVVDAEAGGITQKISAYEVVHKLKDGSEKKITFLDTPGHEAFTAIRSRGAKVADIAILVVSAEDGVRPQTLEAFKIIEQAKIPFIIALNKIDREGADIERTKGNLAENGMYVEGYGGNISYVPISAKTGQGVPDLLDMIMLVADVEQFTGDASVPATGAIIEANLDRKKGLSASLIVKNGTLKTGMHIVAGTAISPVRIMENFLGKPIKDATFSSPIRIIGWNELPIVGSVFQSFDSKKEAEQYVEEQAALAKKPAQQQRILDTKSVLPIIIKANEVGGLDALKHEVAKIKNDKLTLRIVQASVGDITENDVKTATASPNTVILGFNTKIDNSAKNLAESNSVSIQTFDIIYKLSEWLAKEVLERAPKTFIEEQTGLAKVLKVFSKVKDKQVLGGKVETGKLSINAEVKLMRRDFEIGRGRIRELQHFKNKVSEVSEGQEFGALIESKIEIASGDRLQAFNVNEK